MILCGDIGATKSLLGYAEQQGDRFRMGFVKRYENRDWPSFDRLVIDFIAAAAEAAGRPAELTMAAFGVAGPVGPDGVLMTNRDWQFGDGALRSLLGGAPVHLLNDFEANAYGLADVPPDGLLTLQQGKPVAGAPQLVIGAGSGLGVAFRLAGPNGTQVLAGEGGHIGFAPRNVYQAGLWRHLQERFGRVSAEHVVSGPGLVRIHDWLGGSDGTPAGSFLDAFRDKGPHAALAASLPVHLVIDERLPLLGAARAAWEHAGHH